jgi:hypothetical protein
MLLKSFDYLINIRDYLKYPALPGIQDKVKEIEWLIMAKKNLFCKGTI